MARKKGFPAGSVCKPCWELKYCPYGPIVEYYPWAGASCTPEEVKGRYNEVLARLMNGECKTEQEVWWEIEALHTNSPGNWEHIQQFASEEVNCKIFGHACPVFFSQSGATETKEYRQAGRYIPRPIMLQVVRRDNHVCQECHKYVPDDQIEFDHVIPVSKGGPTSVANLRLLCRPCNRTKSNAVDALLITR